MQTICSNGAIEMTPLFLGKFLAQKNYVIGFIGDCT